MTTAQERLQKVEAEIAELSKQLEDSNLLADERRVLQSKLAILQRQRVSLSISAKREAYERQLSEVYQ